MINLNILLSEEKTHKCDYCADVSWDKVSIEIEKMYRHTFERLSILSSYPKYYQNFWKRFQGLFGRVERQKQSIIADHLIQWCKSDALSSDLILDVQSNQNESDDHIDICDSKNGACINFKCIQTITKQQKKLIAIIKGIESFNEYGQRVLYRHDFISLMKTIHECDHCKCPKAALEHCQVSIDIF